VATTNHISYLLSKKAIKPCTIKRKARTIGSMLNYGVELGNPDRVIAFLSTVSSSSGTKDIAIDSYKDFGHDRLTEVKDILDVREMLGHANIDNTLRYIHLANAVQQEQDKWTHKVAETLEAVTLVEKGFECVTEMDDTKIFRKRRWIAEVF
jgi:hypothetical protein